MSYPTRRDRRFRLWVLRQLRRMGWVGLCFSGSLAACDGAEYSVEGLNRDVRAFDVGADAAIAFTCYAKDIDSLRGCAEGVKNLSVKTIVFSAMIDNDVDKPVLEWEGANNITLRGDRPLDPGSPRGIQQPKGHKSSLIVARHSSNVVFEDLTIKGAQSSGSKEECRDCGALVWMYGMKQLSFDRSYFANSRADALTIVASSDVEFKNSYMLDAGEMGLHAGYDEPENRVKGLRVTDSTFENCRVNALWLSVARQSSDDDNVVTGNRFKHNHWWGMYDVPGKRVRYEGGQIAFGPDAESLRFQGNLIEYGSCENCSGKNSHGIEVNSSKNIRILNNTVTKVDGYPLYANSGSRLVNFLAKDNNFAGNKLSIISNVEKSGGKLENNSLK